MMADKTIPLCKDCKHFRRVFEWCGLPIGVRTSLVHGEDVRHLNKDAHRERSSDCTWFGRERCGPEGRFFEAIEPPEYQKVYNAVASTADEIIGSMGRSARWDTLSPGTKANESTIERYSRYAQEMQQIRKDEWED